MTDNNNKKRRSSFRKIFPSLFFSNKSKEKATIQHSNPKMNTDCSTSRSNHYQTHQTIFTRYDHQTERQEHDERIYENLSTAFVPSINNSISTDILSNHSSSSTLVSENVRSVKQENLVLLSKNESDDIKYMARPQVPPKPQNEIHSSQYKIPYPDVYYHSLEKLTNKISPQDEIEIYKASKAHAHPASVGAEIKKVSTKFLISPKKEADVRMIQPIRARSLSPDDEISKNMEKCIPVTKTDRFLEKPYNYSAPTSPVAIGHKIPNMPKTVSPYEHVRKTMIEAEEKRNSISRSNSRTKFTPPISPRSSSNIPKSPPLSKDRVKIEDFIKKEKTRQKVEAFYWQKIKELKQKEDDYLVRQSLNGSIKVPKLCKSTYSNRSTPSSYVMDSRSCSLPRGTDINSGLNHSVHTDSSFIRGAPERRTDSYISNRTFRTEADIVYRYPEKCIENAGKSLKQPIENKNVNPVLVKEVSAARQNFIINQGKQNVRNSDSIRVRLDFGARNLKNPPQPPLRTTSVTSSDSNYRLITNHKNTFNCKSAIRSLCSESESGSETGETQRIMQSRARKASNLYNSEGIHDARINPHLASWPPQP